MVTTCIFTINSNCFLYQFLKCLPVRASCFCPVNAGMHVYFSGGHGKTEDWQVTIFFFLFTLGLIVNSRIRGFVKNRGNSVGTMEMEFVIYTDLARTFGKRFFSLFIFADLKCTVCLSRPTHLIGTDRQIDIEWNRRQRRDPYVSAGFGRGYKTCNYIIPFLQDLFNWYILYLTCVGRYFCAQNSGVE